MDAAAKNELKEFMTGKQTLLNKLKNFDETKKKELQNDGDFKELMRLLKKAQASNGGPAPLALSGLLATAMMSLCLFMLF